MRALRWHGPRDLRLEDVAQPTAEPGRLVVEVALCGLCGTDLHEYAHGPSMIPRGPHRLTGQEPPVTLGHEFVGRVGEIDESDRVAAEAAGLRVGTRVVVDPTVRCGACRWCRVGQYQQCPASGSIGLAVDGGFASHVRAPLGNVHVVPDAVPDELAAVAEPLAVGLHAVTRGGVRPGDNVLVQGAGPIGLACVLSARAAGAGQVFVSEPSPARGRLATELGADVVLDPTASDVRREVFLATGRVGPDVVLEATGVNAVAVASVDTVRRGGTVVMAGIGGADLTLDARKIVLYERTVRGSLGYSYDIPRVLALMAAGRLDPRPMISGVVPLADGIAAFDALLADRSSGAKVLLQPER
ncbi:2,3-butanediol dehydrogenase [Nocardioides pantholopis]|uniref:2,3-butanediol dehydrogenase n=1 Tax=Nocardioides pantholopis TaxID=2483798 RepID=UPI000F0937A7|nr:2,3-butanediol dehydrogenase [Nocardioides pantholopis]